MRSRTAVALVIPALLAGLAGCGGTSNAGYAADPPPPTYPASPKPRPTSADDYGVETPSGADRTATQVGPAPQRPAAVAPRAAAPRPSSGSSAPAPASFDGLKPGDRGDGVRALQQRLQSGGFWVGSLDGSYGLTTTQAVMAVQKAAGLTRDGVMGSRTRQALDRGVSVAARSSGGHWIEVDKARQLVLIVDGGTVQTILNSSTGSGKPYTYQGQTSIANTPSGRFTMFRQVDALDKGPLGDLWRPKYFNGGIALHGSADVPAYPASHGCARVSNPAIDWIWSTNQAPLGTNVWVY